MIFVFELLKLEFYMWLFEKLIRSATREGAHRVVHNIKGLLEAGVPAVIATSVPIEDRKAMEFAEQFYAALANRRTIEQAEPNLPILEVKR